LKEKLLERFHARGHEKVTGTHRSTIELTKENFLTKNGDCIIGIDSQKSCNDLNPKTKEKIKKNSKFLVVLKAEASSDSFFGFGHNNLTHKSQVSMVFRKSNFICDRTVLINCNKSAIDLDRNLIQFLKDPHAQILIEIYNYD
jgi:hypothetical protein